ncbi:PAS domain-containing protein [Propionivibrio sp.]|uniref:PAS domain-containing protein n=1 Tax=Propionivibrio sp. TaxID=2212460 RepID=UPI0025D4DE2E|nr:PAS domain-containing protein [Propionivibrio sp.]MBK7356310.1 PAS domain S-box protein [Propionivibrio sp.]
MSGQPYDPKEIHRAAEERYARTSTASAIRPASEELVYELRVHQIELEMQHEQLRQAQEALEISRDRFVDLYEFAPNAYFTLTRDGLIAESNLKASTMLGVERKNLRQRRFARFVADQDQDRWYRLFQNMRESPGEQTHETDLVLVRNDGSTFDARLDCLRKTGADESWTLRIALVDISRLKQAEAELRIAAIAFESQEGMMITDAQGIILKVNQAFCSMSGYGAEEVIGRDFCLLQSACRQAETCSAMWRSANLTGFWSGEIWSTRKNGEDFAEQLTLSAVRNDEGVITHFVAVINDNTLKRAAAEEIKRLAFYDFLTHLPNRRLLLDRLN